MERREECFVSERFLVFYENPFWVGVLERNTDGKLSVCKVTFGAEPKEPEILEFLLKNYYRLRFSGEVEDVKKPKEKMNPKRVQRQARRELSNGSIGTKSQNALKQQYEAGKTERKERRKEEKEAELLRLFELKQKKKKEKHRGH